MDTFYTRLYSRIRMIEWYHEIWICNMLVEWCEGEINYVFEAEIAISIKKIKRIYEYLTKQFYL